MRHYLVSIVIIFMKLIIPQFVFNPQEDQKGARHADGKIKGGKLAIVFIYFIICLKCGLRTRLRQATLR